MLNLNLSTLLILSFSVNHAFCGLVQAVFKTGVDEVETAVKPRHLHGRFLQITDMHPDMHYVQGASANKACHRSKPKKKKIELGTGELHIRNVIRPSD
ncbi:hypothetical protein PM082_005464 [Marasmius tenuissimus]|nr:hypothetical protein PM082_005464 [Marasmius tenuissimus]